MRTPFRILLVAAGIAASGMLVAAAAPHWAYPVLVPETSPLVEDGKPRTVPGSTRQLTLTQITNLFDPPDWFPDEHPTMPGIVGKGVPPKGYACGYCHLPNGWGKPENGRLAGLPVRYFMQQVADLRSGARKSAIAETLPHRWMLEALNSFTDEQIRVAAEYFSKLPQPPADRTRVVETEMVPTTKVAGWILVPDGTGRKEPIGQRIIETAEDYSRTALRDPYAKYTAYVPVGAVKKGEMLATTGGAGKTLQCNICHGPDLRGIGDVPRIAGVSAIYTSRQMFDMKDGRRNGPGAALMKAVVAKLTEEDIVSLSAYLTSLAP
jgi:cytochrome c553